jgi:hypothetical protein
MDRLVYNLCRDDVGNAGQPALNRIGDAVAARVSRNERAWRSIGASLDSLQA